MNPKEVINELLRDNDFGEPWRLSENNAGIIVPVLSRYKPTMRRAYLMLEEVKDKITIQDSGAIDKAKVRNDTDKPVFLRGGGVLQGQGTQSRAVQFGVVIMPQKEQLVPVLCIHASHGIRSSAFFAHKGYAPRMVTQRLASRDQGATWSAVQNYARASSFHLSAMGVESNFAADDLVHAAETIERFRTDIEESLKKIPGDLENQVGVVILGINGVVGLEVFDHPESWQALSKSVMRQYQDVIAEEKIPDYLSINMEKVKDKIKDFLERAKETQGTEIHRVDGTSTTLIKGTTTEEIKEAIIGEYTLINTKAIHLLLTRKEKEPRGNFPPIGTPRLRELRESTSPGRPVIGVPSTSRESQYPADHIYTTTPEHFFRRRGSFQFLTKLEQGPKTWTDLTSDFKSTATLSKRAKEAAALGLVQKTLRVDNGREVYKLTQAGQETLKKVKEVCAQ